MSNVKKEFAAERGSIPDVHDFVKATLDANGISGLPQDDLVLACDEAATNIVEYGFKTEPKKSNHFTLALKCNKKRVTATFFHRGVPFNPENVPEPDIKKNLSGERKGGYGVFLIRRLVDKIVYSARERLNVTRITKGV